jgi:hypothetical protein
LACAEVVERERDDWNTLIAAFPVATWFDAPWLFTECFMYRRIAECFTLDGEFFADYDWFGEQKRNAMAASWEVRRFIRVDLWACR